MTIERIEGLDEANYGLDELVAKDAVVHIERMASNSIWMQVTAGDRTVTLNLYIKKRTLWVNVDDEPAHQPEVSA